MSSSGLFDMYRCACKHANMGVEDHLLTAERLSPTSAAEVARIMGALSTASRVRILARLRLGECTVGDLSAELQMEQPAISHQLRVLRDLGFVVGTRTGRHVVYGLFDTHVAALLDEALRHIDHLSGNGQLHNPDPALNTSINQ
jgi:DNA-binding transcriptional ArsR family regulator